MRIAKIHTTLKRFQRARRCSSVSSEGVSSDREGIRYFNLSDCVSAAVSRVRRRGLQVVLLAGVDVYPSVSVIALDDPSKILSRDGLNGAGERNNVAEGVTGDITTEVMSDKASDRSVHLVQQVRDRGSLSDVRQEERHETLNE